MRYDSGIGPRTLDRTLTNAAAKLKRDARRSRALPAVWWMSDGASNPARVIERLPHGAAVVLRHYDDPERVQLARDLAGRCRRRGLVLVVAGDWRLAAHVGASGLHLPQYLARRGPAPGARLWRRAKHRLVSAAAHDGPSLRRAKAIGADAAMLSPIFPTTRYGNRPALGVLRLLRSIRGLDLPVMALGGVTAATVRRLQGSGFAGIAGIGFALDERPRA